MKKIIIFLLCVVLLIILFIKISIVEEDNGELIISHEEDINFIKTGNVVINNPGMKEDIWYLIYEEPGSPAKSVELFFKEVPNINIGDRLRIEGFFDGEKVIVNKIVDNFIDF